MDSALTKMEKKAQIALICYGIFLSYLVLAVLVNHMLFELCWQEPKTHIRITGVTVGNSTNSSRNETLWVTQLDIYGNPSLIKLDKSNDGIIDSCLFGLIAVLAFDGFILVAAWYLIRYTFGLGKECMQCMNPCSTLIPCPN